MLPPKLAKAYGARDGYRVVRNPSADCRGLGIPSELPFTLDSKVRLAINLGINRQAMIGTVLAGAGKPAATPISPYLTDGYDTDATFQHDPGQAERLLDKAGWRKGAERRLGLAAGEPWSAVTVLTHGRLLRATPAPSARRRPRTANTPARDEAAGRPMLTRISPAPCRRQQAPRRQHIRIAGILIGTVNAPFIGIFRAAQQSGSGRPSGGGCQWRVSNTNSHLDHGSRRRRLKAVSQPGSSRFGWSPSSAAGQAQSRVSGSKLMVRTTSSRSRSMFWANISNTSVCVTDSLASIPASMSVTRAMDV